jgi:hypothetical protein
MIQAWASHSLKRFFMRYEGEGMPWPVVIHAARGQRVSFQACFKARCQHKLDVKGEVVEAGGLMGGVRLRAVGHVPVGHFNTQTPTEDLDGVGILPGFAPDVLLPVDLIVAGDRETHTFWVTVNVPLDAAVGEHVVKVKMSVLNVEGMTAQVEARVVVHELALKPRANFPMTHWFYADALMDWYKVDAWSEEHWAWVAKYMKNYAEHGNDVIYAPVFTPPLDGVKRPTQLLHVTATAEGDWKFDWTQVKRWISTARAAGIKQFEWTHWFTQWGVKHAIRIYEGFGHDEKLLWPVETGATSELYRRFLGRFLPELHRFLTVEGLLGDSYFHVSDEPHDAEHRENYIAAGKMLKELAPWMKTMDALSEIEYGRQKLTDMPIPIISKVLEYRAEKIPCWTYFCCGPRGRSLNRLIDTPLAKIRMAGWLFYRFEARGFLHWGYNYWYKRQTRTLIDPYACLDGGAWPGWAYGDPFVVYPGVDGPIDSIRWEVFYESMQDYRLLQTAGVNPEDGLLASLESFDEFPRSAEWILSTRKRLLEGR